MELDKVNITVRKFKNHTRRTVKIGKKLHVVYNINDSTGLVKVLVNRANPCEHLRLDVPFKLTLKDDERVSYYCNECDCAVHF